MTTDLSTPGTPADPGTPAGGGRPAVSVVVCAYTDHRWAGLTGTVRATLAQLTAADECLLVIDHNDVLRRRAAAWFSPEPAVRVLANDEDRGLSGARNTGIRHSRGDVIAFLDDDATPAAGWLAEFLAGFDDPAVAAVGGAALPRWPTGHRPAWFPPEFDWVVGCSYRGLPTRAAPVRNVIGAAMAFRSHAFEVAGTFDSAVGRVGTTPLGCEETELCIRLRQADPHARIVYLPAAVVHHQVTADRTRIRYLLRRCFAEGTSKARVSRLVGAGDALASERTYVRRVLPRAVVRELRRTAHGDPAGLAAATVIIAGLATAALGYLAELAGPAPTPTATTAKRGQRHVPVSRR